MGRARSLQAYEQVLGSLSTKPPSQTNWICGPCLTKITSLQQKRKLSGSRGPWRREVVQIGSEEQVPGYDDWAAGRRLCDQGTAASTRREDAVRIDMASLRIKEQRTQTAKEAARKQAESIRYLGRLTSQQQAPSHRRKRVSPASPDEASPSLDNANIAPIVETRRLALISALQQRSLNEVVQLLSDAMDDHAFYVSIPATAWSQILEVLNPNHVSAPLHKIHRSFNPARLKSIGVVYRRSVKVFMENVVKLIRMRRDHGSAMTLADYRILLRHVSARGDASLGRVLWNEMQRDNVRPDLTCFSAYMSVIIWDEESRIAGGRRMRRRTTRNLDPRSQVTLLEQGSSGEVKSLMEQMRSARIVPDTDCYCTYMTALARDGHMLEAEDVLTQVFHVDVDSIMVGQTDELQSMPPRPNIQHNNKLLITIAEIFGGANRIPTALSIIDYISTTYNVPVSSGVWYKLAQWTWIQARTKPSERSSMNGQQQMHLNDVPVLGELMVAAPYNTKPSIFTRDAISRSAGNNDSGTEPRFSLLLYQIEMARHEYIALIIRYRRQRAKYFSMLRQRHVSRQLGQMNVEITGHRLHQLTIKKQMTHVTIQRLARKMLSLKGIGYMSGQWGAEIDQWRVVGLPNFVLRWEGFLPDQLKYRIRSGIVELEFRTKEDRAKQAARKSVARRRRNFQWFDIISLKQPWMFRELGKAARSRLKTTPQIIPTKSILQSHYDITAKPHGMFDQSYGD